MVFTAFHAGCRAANWQKRLPEGRLVLSLGRHRVGNDMLNDGSFGEKALAFLSVITSSTSGVNIRHSMEGFPVGISERE